MNIMYSKFTQLELFLVVLFLLVSKGYCHKLEQPEFTMPLENITIHMGRNVTFTCYVKNIQNNRVGWVKADTKAIQAIGMHVITHNPRIRVNQEGRHKYYLHVLGATLEDAGPYMCQLNTNPMKSQVGHLKVIQPSDITHISGSDGVVEGGTARLTCEAEGHPRPDIYWTREEKGQLITIWDKSTGRKREVSRVEGKTLELLKVRRSQMGNYLCIATNGFPPAVSKRVRLNVNFRPVISVPDQKVYAKIGQDVTIECMIEAFPLGINYWELESGEMLSNNNKYSKHEYKLSEYTVRSRLSIANFDERDIGVYRCICKNSMNGNGDRVEGVVYLNLVPEERPVVTTTEEYSFQDYIEYSPNIKTKFESTTFLNSGSNSEDSSSQEKPSLEGDGRGYYSHSDPADNRKRQKERRKQEQQRNRDSSSNNVFLGRSGCALLNVPSFVFCYLLMLIHFGCSRMICLLA